MSNIVFVFKIELNHQTTIFNYKLFTFSTEDVLKYNSICLKLTKISGPKHSTTPSPVLPHLKQGIFTLLVTLLLI